MTSKEISSKAPAETSTNAWLKEIAFQLALINEKRGPGRPPKQ